MKEPGGHDHDPRSPEDHGEREIEPDLRAPSEGVGALDLETALERGQVDLKGIVRWLVCRLSATQSRLAQVGRRVSQVESRLAGLASRASEHQEAIQLMSLVLKDLDDPYGFGLSLDERITSDGPDRTPEEEA